MSAADEASREAALVASRPWPVATLDGTRESIDAARSYLVNLTPEQRKQWVLTIASTAGSFLLPPYVSQFAVAALPRLARWASPLVRLLRPPHPLAPAPVATGAARAAPLSVAAAAAALLARGLSRTARPATRAVQTAAPVTYKLVLLMARRGGGKRTVELAKLPLWMAPPAWMSRLGLKLVKGESG